MTAVWQIIDEHRHTCHSWQDHVEAQTRAMTTNTILESVATIALAGGLAAPIAYLLERTHRRDLREHGRRTSWTPARHDADTRRIAEAIGALTTV